MQEIAVNENKVITTEHIYQTMIDDVEYYAIILLDVDGTIKKWNKGAEKIIGYTSKEIIGKNFSSFFNTVDRKDRLPENLLAQAEENDNVLIEGWRLKKDGSSVWVKSSLTALRDKTTHATMGFTKIIFDNREKRETEIYSLKEQNKSEKKLRKNEDKYRSLIENISDGFIALDKNFCYTYANKRIGEITGFDPEFLIGKNICDVFPEFKETLTNKLFIQAFNEQRYMCNIEYYETLNLWQENHIYPSVDGLSIFIRNISEQKKSELVTKQLNKSLEERVKLRTVELTKANEALESFSYMVSHDLQAPLRTLTSFTNAILDRYSVTFDPPLQKLFGSILNSSKRMNLIISDLLKLAKFGKEKLSITTIQTTTLFQKVWNDLNQISNSKAKFQISELPDIKGDISMIEQVIINLLSNAIKYSAKKTNPEISVGYSNSLGKTIFFVKDNGAGFSMKNYDKLFGAFQRLHKQTDFEGTGVGLLLVKKIIENHGGTIWAESKIGEGATFYFIIP